MARGRAGGGGAVQLGSPEAEGRRIAPGKEKTAEEQEQDEGTKMLELGTMNVANAAASTREYSMAGGDGSGEHKSEAAPLELGLMLPRIVIVLTEDATESDASAMQAVIDRSHRGVHVLPLHMEAADFYAHALLPAFGRAARWQRLSMGKAQGMLGKKDRGTGKSSASASASASAGSKNGTKGGRRRGSVDSRRTADRSTTGRDPGGGGVNTAMAIAVAGPPSMHMHRVES